MADIDPDAHDWNNPVCAWSKDNQSCTTAHVCKTDENAREADADAIIGRETKAPACTEKGETTYMTAFNVDWASERIKNRGGYSRQRAYICAARGNRGQPLDRRKHSGAFHLQKLRFAVRRGEARNHAGGAGAP